MARLRAALTFDAEHPDRPARTGRTDEVLDILEQHGVPATFFLQGRWVEAYPQLARRAAARHLIGSHSHYHARMPLFSAAGFASDLDAAERVIRKTTGMDPRPWFRCPFGTGASDPRLVDALAAHGYRHVGWHVEAKEWRIRARAAEVADDVVNGVLEHGDGAIVLLHPWPNPMAGALPAIISRLREAGVELVRLDGLSLPGDLSPVAFPRPQGR
jgi:peptidoglycan/xylan/chitin deacetylase (PgdA/CDA1 family)